MKHRKPLAIVGAGLTGLCLAQILRRQDIPCFLLDKGRSPGGRMATMMHEAVPIDYGPGWFHTDDARMLPEVREALRSLQAEEVDANGLPDDVRLRIPATDGIRCWHVPGGIRRIADRLAGSLDVSSGHHVRRIERTPSGWRISSTVASNQGQEFLREASALVLTQPWPQLLELLDNSGLKDLAGQVIEPAKFAYDRVMVLVLESDVFPLSHEFLRHGEITGVDPIRSIRWRIAGRPDHGAILTILADPGWSESHWEDSDEEVRGHLLFALDTTFGRSVRAALIRLHRWKFARLAVPAYGCPSPVVLSAEPLAIAAGEAFGVTPESPAGLLSAQASASLAASILHEWGSGLSAL